MQLARKIWNATREWESKKSKRQGLEKHYGSYTLWSMEGESIIRIEFSRKEPSDIKFKRTKEKWSFFLHEHTYIIISRLKLQADRKNYRKTRKENKTIHFTCKNSMDPQSFSKGSKSVWLCLLLRDLRASKRIVHRLTNTCECFLKYFQFHRPYSCLKSFRISLSLKINNKFNTKVKINEKE